LGQRRLVPHLSCWERQAEGVDQRAKRGKAGLHRLDMRERHQVEPREEQAGTDVRLEEQPKVVELVLPAAAGVPSWKCLQRGDQRRQRCGWLRTGRGGRRRHVPEGREVKRDPRDEPVKQADHAMDATRYALHGELGEAARTEAYLAEMQRRLAGMQAQGSGSTPCPTSA
jgi:hypothetical protein